MILLRGLAKRYDGAAALGPIDLELSAGSTTALIGPSGSGKSTLLRLLVGLIAPSQGSVRVDGLEVRPENLRELRRRTGYVVQEGGLFPHLSCEENLALAPRSFGLEIATAEARIDASRALVRLPESLLKRRPSQLSGGQRRRVALMRALMLDPDLLLLDEPLGALDPMIRAELQDDLREIFRRIGKTVVVVTHDLGEAAYLCERIVLLRNGRLVQHGTIDDLIHRPADPFVTEFIRAQRSHLHSFIGTPTQ